MRPRRTSPSLSRAYESDLDLVTHTLDTPTPNPASILHPAALCLPCDEPRTVTMSTNACLASQVCLGCVVACSAAGGTPRQAGLMQSKGRAASLIPLRGGEGFRPSKLQRTYSMSGIVPPAADPTHLEADMSSGEMDVHMKTARCSPPYLPPLDPPEILTATPRARRCDSTLWVKSSLC